MGSVFYCLPGWSKEIKLPPFWCGLTVDSVNIVLVSSVGNCRLYVG